MGLIKVVTQNLRGKNVMFLVSVNPLLSRLHANMPIMHGYVWREISSFHVQRLTVIKQDVRMF